MTDVTIQETPVAGIRVDAIAPGTYFTLTAEQGEPLFNRSDLPGADGQSFICVDAKSGESKQMPQDQLVFPVKSVAISFTRY